MNMNYSKLKGKIVEKCGTYANYANALGISSTTLTSRLANYTEFKRDEIIKSKEILELTPEELIAIFFTEEVKKS